MRKYFLLIALALPILLLSLEHIGPPGVWGWHLAVDKNNGNAYIGTKNETVYKVDPVTNTWQEMIIDFEDDEKIGGIAAYDDVVFVGTTEHIYRSLDGGNNWEIAQNGIPNIGFAENLHIYEPEPNIVFVQTGMNIWFRSTNGGSNWSSMPYFGSQVFSYNPNTGFILIINKWTMWKSYDIGENWEEIQYDFFNNYDLGLTSVQVINDSAYIVTAMNNDPGNSVFITEDGGETWNDITYDFFFPLPTDLELIQDEVYLSVVRGESEAPDAGVFKLDMEAQTWNKMGNSFFKENTGLRIGKYENDLYFLSYGSGLFMLDVISGTIQNFTPMDIFELNSRICVGNSFDEDKVFIRSAFLYATDTNFSEWTRIDSVYNIFEMGRSPYDDNFCIALSIRNGVYISNDCGETWTLSNYGIAEEDRQLINNVHFLNENTILISGYEAMLMSPNTKTFIYRSEDQGQTWTKTHQADELLGEKSISLEEIIQVDNTLYACMMGAGIQKSEDLGLTWESVFYLENRVFYQILFDEQSEMFYVRTVNTELITGFPEIFRSSDLINWTDCAQTFSEEYYISDIALHPTQSGTIYCSTSSIENYNGTAPHLVISNDNGDNWFFYTFDEINTFRRVVDIGFVPNTNEMLICVAYLSMFKFDVNLLGANDFEFIKPTISLSNYPNPFNPETKIVFNLPEEGNVKLEIYNIKGQKVKTLLDCYMSPGRSEMIWNGKDDNGKRVSSGVYFYQLVTDKKTITQKMILIK